MKKIFLFILFVPLFSFGKLERAPGFLRLQPRTQTPMSIEDNESLEAFCIRAAKVKQVKCKDGKVSWLLPFYKNPNNKEAPLGIIEIYPSIKKNGGYIVVSSKDINLERLESIARGGEDGAYIVTYLTNKGPWVQLPKHPFKTPVWVNLEKDWGGNLKSHITKIEHYGIYESDEFGSFVVISVNGETIEYRDEYENDFPCLNEPVKKTVPVVKKAPLKKFLDKNNHLKFAEKYRMGC